MTAIPIALAASLAIAGPALAADATGSGTTPQPRTQDREHVRAQVHHAMTTEGEVSEQDANDVDGEVSEHAGAHGYGPAMSQAIHDAHAQGCTGQCLVKVVHDINHAMDQGATADAAAKRATDKVSHASGKSSDPQAHAPDHRRDGAHHDAAADRAHDRTTDHGGAGAHGMGSGRH